MGKATDSDRYLRSVAAAAIRVVRLERADFALMQHAPPAWMYSNRAGQTIMEHHQRLWKKMTKAREALKQAVLKGIA